MSWTPERVDLVRGLLLDGYTTGQAAFVMKCTRNALIGVAHRKNLVFAGKHDRQRPTVAANPSKQNRPRGVPRPPQVKPARTTQFRPPPKVSPREEPADAPRAIPPAPDSRPVDLMGLTATTCRWPLWGEGPTEPKLYCGAETDATYCPFHAAASIGRTYTRAERREYHRQREAGE